MGFCSQGVNAFSFGAVMHPDSPGTEASGASQTSASETLHQAVRLYPLAHPLFIVIIIIIFVFCLFRAAPAAHGGSQSRDLIGAVASSLFNSLINADLSHICDIPCSLWQCQILNPLRKARDGTCFRGF